MPTPSHEIFMQIIYYMLIIRAGLSILLLVMGIFAMGLVISLMLKGRRFLGDGSKFYVWS